MLDTKLKEAILKGDLEQINDICSRKETHRQSKNLLENDLKEGLTIAAQNAKLEVVKLLHQKGVSLSTNDFEAYHAVFEKMGEIWDKYGVATVSNPETHKNINALLDVADYFSENGVYRLASGEYVNIVDIFRERYNIPESIPLIVYNTGISAKMTIEEPVHMTGLFQVLDINPQDPLNMDATLDKNVLDLILEQAQETEITGPGNFETNDIEPDELE